MTHKDLSSPSVLLVATNLTDYSDRLVHTAAKFAISMDAEIYLVHVIERSRLQSLLTQTPGSAASFEQAYEQEKREESLQKQVDRCIPKETKVKGFEVIDRTSTTYQAILDQAVHVGASAIALGPHSGSTSAAHFVGTTAERIVRTADIPCLLLRDTFVEAPSRVGVAVDLSPMTDTVLSFAGRWAHALGGGTHETPLELLYVGWWVEQKDNPSLEENTVVPAIEKSVAAMGEISPALASINVHREIRWENEPVKPIIAWAEAKDLDLLVMGTHGLTGLKRALLGSTASAVLRAARCPMLLVPPVQ